MRASIIIVAIESGVLASCALACQATNVLPLPSFSPDAKSYLLVSRGPDQSPDVRAGEPPLLPTIHRRGETTIELLEFRCPLETLGLIMGPQPMLDMPAPSIELPTPIAVATLDIIHGQEDSWTEGQVSDETREVLSRLALPERNLCRSSAAKFEAVELVLPNDVRTEPAFTLALEDSALIGSRNGFYYRVDRDEHLESISTIPADQSYVAAFRADDGELWLLGQRGKLIHGALDRGFTATSTTHPFGPGVRVAMDGARGGAQFELFVETSSRAFIRFDGHAWTTLATSYAYDSVFFPAVAWIAPGEAIAIGVGRARNTVVRYRDGAVHEELLPGESGTASVRHFEGVGTIVGRDDGGLVIDDRTGAGWKEIASDLELFYVRTFIPIDGGFMYGAAAEVNFLEYRFVQYFPGAGHCPPVRLSDRAVMQSAPLGGSAYAATMMPGYGDPLRIAILRQTAPAGACGEPAPP